MKRRRDERGAALLTVLMLVAVMAVVAAAAMDRIGLATRLAGNGASVAQGRAWLTMAEQLGAARLDDALSAGADLSDWIGEERTIVLPDGAVVSARLEAGGNCFNLNSLVDQRGDILAPRRVANQQFRALMIELGIAAGEAAIIADSATDAIDSGNIALPAGEEDGSSGLSPNQLMVDASELRAVRGMDATKWATLRPWVCALPTTDLSPIAANTMRPEQAPLLVMLAPIQISRSQARAVLAARPNGGYSSVFQFWQAFGLKEGSLPNGASEQVVLTGRYYRIHARVESGDRQFGEQILIDTQQAPSQIVARQWELG